jgi:hypothetical protein
MKINKKVLEREAKLRNKLGRLVKISNEISEIADEVSHNDTGEVHIYLGENRGYIIHNNGKFLDEKTINSEYKYTDKNIYAITIVTKK